MQLYTLQNSKPSVSVGFDVGDMDYVQLRAYTTSLLEQLRFAQVQLVELRFSQVGSVTLPMFSHARSSVSIVTFVGICAQESVDRAAVQPGRFSQARFLGSVF
jgi:hypothetical protein